MDSIKSEALTYNVLFLDSWVTVEIESFTSIMDFAGEFLAKRVVVLLFVL